MNWKASLFGAVLVAVCGLAVGAAIGGKTKDTTKTVHVTVTSTVTTTSPETTSTPTTGSTETDTSSTPATETSPEAGQQYLAEYLAGQDSEQLERTASEVSLSSEPAKQALQGQTYQQAVVFNIENYGSTASFQLPTPGFSRLSSKAIGLETVSNAETYYRLTVYKNNDSSPNSVVLYKASFHGPSVVHKMDFSLQGATDILFVWTKSASEPDSQDVFILSDPVLTK